MEQYDPELIINLIESDAKDFGGDSLHELVPMLERALKPLLAAKTEQDIALLAKIGDVIGRINYADSWKRRIGILLAIAQSMQPVGRSIVGIPLAHSAYSLAQMQVTAYSEGDKLLDLSGALAMQRQAGNALAILYNDIGAPHRGLEFAIAAAVLAKQLNDDVALARCLANATTSLRAQGLHRETISVSLRVLAIATKNPSVPPSVAAHAYGNLAMSAYTMRDYRLGMQSAQHAVSRIQVPADKNEVLNRLAIEGAYIKNLIALNQRDIARERLTLISRMAEPFATPRLDINVELSRSLVEIAEGDAEVGVSRLLALLPKSKQHPFLYADNLEALVRAYEQTGNPEAMAVYSSQLVEHVLKGHSLAIEKQLALIDEKLSTLQPGKEEAFTLIRAAATKHDEPDGFAREDELGAPGAVSPIQAMFEQLAVSAELREDATGRHAYRVGALARMLALKLGYGNRFAYELEAAARLHDIGKLGVRDAILNKPGAFTADDRSAIELHTVFGQRILNLGKRPEFALARTVAMHHHERWDGQGYPRKLAGVQIPVEARITKLVDVWDALTHKRVYKEAWSFRKSYDYFVANRGTEFDPEMTDDFLALITRLYELGGEKLEVVDLDLAKGALDLPSMKARDALDRLIADIPVLWTDPTVPGADEATYIVTVD